MRAFAIVDMTQRASRRKPCATLFYDEEAREYRIEIAPAASEDDVPMLLAAFIHRKQRTLDSKWSRKWVEERVVPPSRQNLGQILKANGLDDYDDFQMLMIGKGRCCQDDFGLVEIDPALSADGKADASKQDALDKPAKARRSQAQSDLTSTPETQGRPAIVQHSPGKASQDADTPTLAAQIGSQLARTRKEAGLSQLELAQRCGLQQAAISRLERGLGNPTLSTIEEVAAQLGVQAKFSLA